MVGLDKQGKRGKQSREDEDEDNGALYSSIKLPDDFGSNTGMGVEACLSSHDDRGYDRRKKDADFIVELEYEGGFDPKAK